MNVQCRAEDVEAARHIRAMLRIYEGTGRPAEEADESKYFLPGDLFSTEPQAWSEANHGHHTNGARATADLRHRAWQEEAALAAELDHEEFYEGTDVRTKNGRWQRRHVPKKVSLSNKITRQTSPQFEQGGNDDGTDAAWQSPTCSGSGDQRLQGNTSGAAGSLPLDQPLAAEAPTYEASKWHSSTLVAGQLSEDGHVFARAHAGPRKSDLNGRTLSSLCMLFERTLRVGGVHKYRYNIIQGCVGAADGVGFVFDSRIRRTNIQRMRSIFLNKRGQVCTRNFDSITKLPHSLPKLAEGVVVDMTVDLDRAEARFEMRDEHGQNCGTAELSFASLLSSIIAPGLSQASGFFCAIVTGTITVSLH